MLALILSRLTVSRETEGLIIIATGSEVLQECVPGAVPAVSCAVFLYVTVVAVRPAHKAIRPELTVWLAAGARLALCTYH